jgi:hypothetical protein
MKQQNLLKIPLDMQEHVRAHLSQPHKVKRIKHFLPIKQFFINILILNIVVEWITLLLHNQEVAVSNISPKTSYPEVFCGSPQSLQANARLVPSITLRLLPSTSFQTHHSPIPLSFGAI